MKYVIAVVLFATVAQAQSEAPVLTPQEQIMVSAVMALQSAATKACEATPEVQSYTAVLTKAQAALKASGKAVDWRTGAASLAKPGN
jgi:hypothetical protein